MPWTAVLEVGLAASFFRPRITAVAANSWYRRACEAVLQMWMPSYRVGDHEFPNPLHGALDPL